MVTMREVAAHARVSQKTVSRVFNDDPHVRPETRERVRSAMRDLGYVANPIAGVFRSGRVPVLGIAVPDVGDPFFAAIVRAVDAVAASTGVTLGYDYVVCASGTTVLDGAGRVLRTRALEPEQVAAVAELVMGRGDTALFASTLDRDLVLHDPTGFGDDPRVYADHFSAATLAVALEASVVALPVYVPDPALADALAARIEAELGLAAPRSTNFIDVVAPGESKGVGLRRLIEYLSGRGTPVSETIALGDSWNDLPLFEACDRSFAMAHAPRQVRQGATDVAASVAQALEGLGDRPTTPPAR